MQYRTPHARHTTASLNNEMKLNSCDNSLARKEQAPENNTHMAKRSCGRGHMYLRFRTPTDDYKLKSKNGMDPQ